MQNKYNGWAIFSLVMAMLLIGISFHDFTEKDKSAIPEGYLSQNAADNLVNQAVLKVSNEKDSIISDLTNQLSEKVTNIDEKVSTITETVKYPSYLIDEINLNSEIVKDVSDREVKTLFDGIVEFDNEDYDAEEVVSISKMKILANEEDFKANPYLVIPENSIEYQVIFDSSLNNSLITEDDTLTFNFLGNIVEVSEWDNDKVVFSKGKENFLKEGESFSVNDKVFEVSMILEDAVYVKDLTTNEGIKIFEGQTKKLSGVEIKAKEVLYTSKTDRVSSVVLIAGDEVKVTIKSGDEYEEDSIFEYLIDSSSIGIILKDEFTELSDDFKPLAVNEKLCLPNDYVCVTFNGFSEEDFEKISFDLDKKNSLEYVKIIGNFQKGLKDYDKLYINSTGIYDKDLELIGLSVTISDSDSELDVSTGKIVIEDFELSLELNNSNVENDDIDYRTNWGTLISNPEDSIDDLEWTINFPLEKLEGSISLI